MEAVRRAGPERHNEAVAQAEASIHFEAANPAENQAVTEAHTGMLAPAEATDQSEVIGRMTRLRVGQV